ncbi:hypothetical protein K0504_18220 [Neiella marina]|uniref:Uncharacterized protein n=1 Tax=Neiella holothuriorum TaxID=2870530 RepID=A0ABS7EKT9_9GAMM|nr:hypothetical protein [Neiella holothuriorum]MBW8192969.1 hypothetical protein [Neiella holothuriorum]
MEVVTIINLTSLIVLELINRKIYSHIKRYFPEHWSKFSEEKMGVRRTLSRPIAIRDAIVSGSFEGEHSALLYHYAKIQKYVAVWAAISILIAFIWLL